MEISNIAMTFFKRFVSCMFYVDRKLEGPKTLKDRVGRLGTGYDAKACPIAPGKFNSEKRSFGQVHGLI